MVRVVTSLSVQVELSKLCANIVRLLLRTIRVLTLRLIVGLSSKVLRVGSSAITLVVANLDTVWLVNRQLLKVGAETMTVSIRIREKLALQNPVIGYINTRHHRRRGESSLLNLCEVITWVMV